jgi:hypothetical protein
MDACGVKSSPSSRDVRVRTTASRHILGRTIASRGVLDAGIRLPAASYQLSVETAAVGPQA